LGASGAIFGIFGAFGAFIVLRRQFLRGGNAIIGQWLFWLAINLYFDFSQSQLNIGTADHIGGVVAGFILGAILIPPLTRIVRSR
jgi:membrane associated rhomboid family serine protease